MDYSKILIEEIEQRFKAETIIDRCKKVVESKIEKFVLEKYKETVITRGDIKLMILGVNAFFWEKSYPHNDFSVVIDIAFVAVSRLPKQKRIRLDAVIEKYKKDKYLEHCGFKDDLWITMRFEYTGFDEIHKAYNGKINLGIY